MVITCEVTALELNGRWNVGEKRSNKNYFFLNGLALDRPPLREELFMRLPLYLRLPFKNSIPCVPRKGLGILRISWL